MARFYAKFDSGSAGWLSAFDSTLTQKNAFKRAYIAQGSASAALLRDGLIASRSAVSAAVKAEIASTYHNGALGTYFPPDSGPFSTDSATFVSWSNVYTSSVAGIIIPADYRTRPTASVLSTMTSLVGGVTPIDSMSISWGLYTSASQAVLTTLQSIVTGSGAGGAATPYMRTVGYEVGGFPQQTNYTSRILHGIWHDKDLTYFAWDDFTPGQPPKPTISFNNGHPTGNRAAPTNYTVYWSTASATPEKFASDISVDGIARVYISFEGQGVPPDNFAAVVIVSASLGEHTFSYPSGSFKQIDTYDIEANVQYLDPTIYYELGANSASGIYGAISEQSDIANMTFTS